MSLEFSAWVSLDTGMPERRAAVSATLSESTISSNKVESDLSSIVLSISSILRLISGIAKYLKSAEAPVSLRRSAS
ncbi:hypothetical protein AWJ20_290 [Sugiyamaella lignohabitans]|uniref:Uncharacterized protein n=1 Tax=Sugiyamaella lignohabitans TaxID=796027 RepID=A0A167CSH6_9ASCO|nr:uncharacterized protein AWJ20_290 [Sugiyamaella lignohabitans]ANB12055.1 hypothetical protein AWJ20_290 [Sugiyamaella lignohabitans]